MMSSKNAVSAQQRNHGGDIAPPPPESTYANSDAISSFYNMQQQKATLVRPLPTQQQQQQQVVSSSVAGEYASLCIAMSSPADLRQNNVTTSQARLRPALFRLSEGFDYDLANPSEQTKEGKLVIGEDHRRNSIPHNNGGSNSNRNSLSLNAADLDTATAMLDQVTGAGPVTYGEYASTAITLEPLMAVEAATGFADPCYTSEEDEDESVGVGMAYRSPVPSSVAAATTNSLNHHYRSQNSRSLPVPMAESSGPSSSGVTDENRPSTFSSLPPGPQTLSTFSGGNNATGHVLPSRVRQQAKSELVTSAAATTVPPQQSPVAATASSSSQLTTAGSGLQALKVRRQLIEAALSGGSGSVATPVVPSVPSANNNGAQQQQVDSNNNNNSNSQPQNSSNQQQQQPRKDVGHLDMSQYSNLEGKVLVGGKAATNVTAKSSSFQEPKPLTKVPPTASDGAASSATTATSQHRNKALTGSSRKGRSGSGTSKESNDPVTTTRFEPSTADADQAAPIPVLPITELSERLAREAKVLAGRRSLVLGANNPALTTSTTTAPANSLNRQPATLPSSSYGNAMSQSLHVGPSNDSKVQQQPQTLPTMLDVCRHHGQIRWTKIIENGKRIKKAWTIYYCVFVTSPPRLFFFKDEKAAMKSPPPAAGNLLKPHQELSVPSPWSVCSQLDLPPKLQFTRRKNVLFLAAPNPPNANTQSSTSGTASSSNNNSTSNSSPPLSDQGPGFPDVAFGYLMEGPGTDQIDVWLKHFLQSGGLLKYSIATQSSPPLVPKDLLSTVANSNNPDPDNATVAPSPATVASNGASEPVQSKSTTAASSSRTTRPSNTNAKGSLMKLLTGFFKRRPTMEHLKKKGYIRDTVFGSSLDNICRRERSEVPAFVMSCVNEIESRGLDTDGLYRTSGNLAQVQKLRCMVDQGQPIVWDKWEIAVLTGALKMFFRELREPLITTDIYEKLTEYATRPDLRRSLDPAGREAYLRRCLAMLPPIHFSTARYLFGHFVHVLEHSSSNRMELQSLAIVVAPNLMAPHTDVRSVAAHALLQKYIAEDLIQFYYNLFFTPLSTDQHHYANSNNNT